MGQDYKNLCKTVETVNKINKNLGTAIVTVTHDKRCAGALADRVLIMENGKYHGKAITASQMNFWINNLIEGEKK